MRHINHILPLRVPLGVAQPSGRPRWKRKTLQGTFVFLGCISLFALFEYASYLSSSEESSQEGSEYLDPSLDTVYLPFQPTPYQQTPTLQPTSPLPDYCLNAHLALGELCYNPQQPLLDVLWTWVNGSDILLRDAKARVENSYPADAPYRPSKSWKQARQFRDHDELRHSMRSVLANFRPHVGRFHLLTSDFEMPFSPNVTAGDSWRLGQVPQWLDMKQSSRRWSDGGISLVMSHHADIFYPYNDSIFNSFAIESQFGHLQGVADNFIYLNDDFYFLDTLTDRTFYTSAYGLVFRMQSDLLVSPTQYAKNLRGEWRSLAAGNVLLSARFGSRHRPYTAHQAKSASLAILHEMSIMWASHVADTATHPFRETVHGDSDFSMMFMMVHFVIERWREGLLWSWAVAKHGGLDDSWGEVETDIAWKELGGTAGMGELTASGSRGTDKTTYLFSSQDGYPYIEIGEHMQNRWPKFAAHLSERDRPNCKIDYKECFLDSGGRSYSHASELFKNIAFRKPSCGDCVVLGVLKASGRLGLSAFLPSSTRTLPSLAGKPLIQNDEAPHLPLVESWEDGDFSLREVMGASREMNIRKWTLQLLQRYRFVIGETPSHFAMLSGPSDANAMIRKLARTPNITLLCVNDDVAVEDNEVTAVLKRWQEERWGTPAAWEL